MTCKDYLSEPLSYPSIPHGWSYRGEGNCHLVISLPNTGKVLHIKKVQRKTKIIGLIYRWVYSVIEFVFFTLVRILRLNFPQESSNIRFYNKVMRPLIGEEYVSEAKEVVITQKQVTLLEQEIENMRPVFRKHKTLQPGRATILDDFALIPDDFSSLEMLNDTFAVEIKPKQGWMPLSMKLFPKCIYCMNQYLKLEKRKIERVSSYCPEEFFSGNGLWMMKSIKALIENPQNNFRIFKNGDLVYGQNFTHMDFMQVVRDMFDSEYEKWSSLKEEFCCLLNQGLTTRFFDCPDRGCNKKFCEWDSSMKTKYGFTFKGTVIERILSVQMLDVEGSSYYNSLINAKTHNCGIAYVDKLLEEIENSSNSTCVKCALMMIANVGECPRKQIDLRCLPYLISSVANDCSLMIAFRKVKRDVDNRGPTENILSTQYGNFAVRIGVFDLFPKKVDTIKRHVIRNEKIFKAYVENLALPQRNKLIGSEHLNGSQRYIQSTSSDQDTILNYILQIAISILQNTVYRRIKSE